MVAGGEWDARSKLIPRPARPRMEKPTGSAVSTEGVLPARTGSGMKNRRGTGHPQQGYSPPGTKKFPPGTYKDIPGGMITEKRTTGQHFDSGTTSAITATAGQPRPTPRQLNSSCSATHSDLIFPTRNSSAAMVCGRVSPPIRTNMMSSPTFKWPLLNQVRT